MNPDDQDVVDEGIFFLFQKALKTVRRLPSLSKGLRLAPGSVLLDTTPGKPLLVAESAQCPKEDEGKFHPGNYAGFSPLLLHGICAGKVSFTVYHTY